MEEKLSNLTYLILHINACIDRGEHDDITIEKIEEHISDGDIFDFLKQNTSMDLSLFGGEYYPIDSIVEELQSILNCYGGNERRKWGIEKKGLCLLLAWVNEILQRSLVNLEEV